VTVWWLGLLGAGVGIGTGLLGAGASIVTVLVLAGVAGLPMASAVSTSLVVVAATSIVALVPYARAGDVMWRSGAAFSLASMAGAFVGGRVSTWLPARVLLVIFALAVTCAAFGMLRRGRPPSLGTTPGTRTSWPAMAAAGLPLGGLTGLVGLGGGFAVLPLLVLWAGTPVRAAVGTTLFVVVMNTLAGLAGHLPHPAIDWRLAGYLGVSASIGSLLGARLARRFDASILRRAFGVLLLVVAVVLLASARRAAGPLS
jgi:uncharacterized membrane protein YfcA